MGEKIYMTCFVAPHLKHALRSFGGVYFVNLKTQSLAFNSPKKKKDAVLISIN
jgi:hypothetical protein